MSALLTREGLSDLLRRGARADLPDAVEAAHECLREMGVSPTLPAMPRARTASPLALLRAVREALVARGDVATLDGEWLYIGDQPVAYVADRGLVVARALCYDGHQHVMAVPSATRQRSTVAEIIALIDERQAARAKSLPEPEAGPSREPGEVHHAA